MNKKINSCNMINNILSVMSFVIILGYFTIVLFANINETDMSNQKNMQVQEAISRQVVNKRCVKTIKSDDSIALTFECESASDDLRNIIQLLDKNNIHASFFVTGIWAEQHKDEVRLIYEHGNDICCHGFTHLKMSAMQKGQIRDELTSFNILITQILNEKEWKGKGYFRAPFNEENSAIKELAGEIGYTVVNDSLCIMDWKNDLAIEDVYKQIDKEIQAGKIVTLHVGNTKCLASLEHLVSRTVEGENSLKIKKITDLMD